MVFSNPFFFAILYVLRISFLLERNLAVAPKAPGFEIGPKAFETSAAKLLHDKIWRASSEIYQENGFFLN